MTSNLERLSQLRSLITEAKDELGKDNKAKVHYLLTLMDKKITAILEETGVFKP